MLLALVPSGLCQHGPSLLLTGAEDCCLLKLFIWVISVLFFSFQGNGHTGCEYLPDFRRFQVIYENWRIFRTMRCDQSRIGRLDGETMKSVQFFALC